MNNAVTATLAVVSGIIGLAIVSVLVSNKAQTPTVISSAGGALANVITAAVSPVTGTSSNNSAYGSSSGPGGFDLAGLTNASGLDFSTLYRSLLG